MTEINLLDILKHIMSEKKRAKYLKTLFLLLLVGIVWNALYFALLNSSEFGLTPTPITEQNRTEQNRTEKNRKEQNKKV